MLPSPPLLVPLMTTHVVACSLVMAALSRKSSKLKFCRFVSSICMLLKASENLSSMMSGCGWM
jgi:hypothetical protein